SDLTELKLIPEVTDEILYGSKQAPLSLNTYLTVYGKEKININVASPSVIAILDVRVGESVAQNIAAARLTSPLKSLDDLKRVPGFPAAVATKRANIWGFESTFFRVLMKVTDKAKRERNYSIVLQRGGTSCKIVRWEE
ncbi:MAG: type II secretion system protein GspK, partial [Synergistaceae bacterium]